MNCSELPALTAREIAEIENAESSGRPVVAFVPGLWLKADSWDQWRRMFESLGYATVAPGRPADPTLRAVTDHYAAALGMLSRKPIVVGHSIGGLVAQQLAARGVASTTVAISPAPERGIARGPISALRGCWPGLRSPGDLPWAVDLSFEQFRSHFANATDAEEARWLYDTYVVPGAGRQVPQTAFPTAGSPSDTKVDVTNPERGPMKIISADRDRIVPWSVACAAFRKQLDNPCHTEFFELLDRGHSLVIDSGWEDVADVALRFVHRTYQDRPRAESATHAGSRACCRV